MSRFEFATATRIVFGNGSLKEVGGFARVLGSSALVVAGNHLARAEKLFSLLGAAGVKTCYFPVKGEPDLEIVERGSALAKERLCDLVVGFGGGSVLDTGKAIAAMMTNEGELTDYLEIIGRGRTLTAASAPYVAIPTTAGTGSEVTRNAVLASPEHRLKVSLRSPLMLPRVALVDPELTYDLPPELTASTGLDALTQMIEPFVCSRSNPMTDSICREGMHRAARSLRRACLSGRDPVAREDMAAASLFGGMALANAGLGAVHGLAGPIGGMFPAPHGAVCAALLPTVMDANLAALRAREPASPALERYREVATLLTSNPAAAAEAGADWVRGLVSELRIPGLREYGVASADLAELATRAQNASSMKANPILLTQDELTAILARAL